MPTLRSIARCVRSVSPAAARAPALIAGLLLAACGAQGPEAPRLVLLYAPCTVNASYLSPHNPAIAFTPSLGKLARDSVVFTNHQTEAGRSGPAYASIFSGTQVDDHGVYRHPQNLPQSLVLISEVFAENGYETFFWSGHAMASADLDYGQGVSPENTFEGGLAPGDPRFLAILDRLRDDPQYRAFVMTNFTVTHSPYPKDHLPRFLRRYPAERIPLADKEIDRYARIYYANRLDLQWSFWDTARRLGFKKTDVQALADVLELLYRSRINLLDDWVGGLLGSLSWYGVARESLVVFTADHGETLFQHNRPFTWSHINALNPEVVHAPLIFHAPGLGLQPGVYRGVTRSIDVFPTVAGLAGIRLPESAGVKGVDLSPALRGEAPPPELLAFSHGSLATAPQEQKARSREFTKLFPLDVEGPERIWVSVKKGDVFYRLRHFGGGIWQVEAYDLAADPLAVEDRFDPEDAEHQAMARRLHAYKDHLVQRYYQRAEVDDPLSHDEKIERLKSLGYL